MSLNNGVKTLKNYAFSDYKVDDTKQGFLRFDAHANSGRAVSFIDIPSQVGKLVVGTVASSLISIYRVTKGTASLLVVIPSLIGWGFAALFNTRHKDYLKSKTVSFLQVGLENLMQGVFTLSIAIPASILLRVFMVSANTLGILLPEVGRWARNLNKLVNQLLFNLNVINERSKDESFHAESDFEQRTHSTHRQGPQYRHNFRPQADLLGGMTTQKALQILGLKKGATLSQAKAAANKLYRMHHPDKGGNRAYFEEARDAFNYLKTQLPQSEWNFGQTAQNFSSTTHSTTMYYQIATN